MSQNTSIAEGGKPRPFGPVKALMVQGEDGKYYSWYPEEDRALDTLSVDKNGVYQASKLGVYGWSSVYVNVPTTGGISGKDPDTGEDVYVHPDPETGELVKDVLPVEIRVTTPPTKTEYAHGETIDYSGIVVHAYSATGQDMGAVSFSQLVFPETTADAQKTDGWTDGQGLNAMQITYTPHWNRAEWVQLYPGRIDEQQVFVCGTALGTYDGGRPATYGGSTGASGIPGTLLATRYYRSDRGEYYNYMASMAGSRKCNLYVYYDGELVDSGRQIRTGWFLVGGSSANAGDKAFSVVSYGEHLTDIPVSTVDPTTVDPTNLHATQSLPVQWQRTGDGAILETTFSIAVTGGN